MKEPPLFPQGLPLFDALISGGESVTIDSRSTIGEGESPQLVSAFGAAGVHLAAGTTVHADVISNGDVWQGSHSTIGGDVSFVGVLHQQDNVTVTGATTHTTDEPFHASSWDIQWPGGAHSDVSLPPDAAEVRLAPGAYDAVNVFSRATLTLRSGTYYFESFNVEPEAKIQIDAWTGPVFIYVREAVQMKAPLVYTSGAPGRVLLGYLGQQTALFQENFVGTVVAPEATIELRRPRDDAPHEGAFFGKRVHVFSDATVLHRPFDYTFLLAHEGIRLVDRPSGVPQWVVDAQPDDDATGVSSRPERRGGGNGLLVDMGVAQAHEETLNVAAASTAPGTSTLSVPGTSAATTGEFTVRITRHSGERDGGSGNAETVLEAEINGHEFSPDASLEGCGTSCPSKSLEIPSDQQTVPVVLTVMEIDKGLNGQDDMELRIWLDVNNFDGTWTGSWEGRRINQANETGTFGAGTNCIETYREYELCWEVETTSRPIFCPAFKTSYADAGRGEPVLGQAGLHSIPAAFAQAEMQAYRGAVLMLDWQGVLDEAGCVPAGERGLSGNFDTQETTGEPLTVTTRLLTDFCFDRSGARCPENAGVQVLVLDGASAGLDGASAGPEQLCVTQTEDPFHAPDPNCEIRDLTGFPGWTGGSTGLVATTAMPGFTDATRAAGVVTTMLAREAATGLGIEQAMKDYGVYTIRVNDPCFEPRTGEFTSHTGTDVMCLQQAPAGGLSDTFFKYILAHEFGHVVQDRSSGSPTDAGEYGLDAGGLWGCEHIDIDRFGNNLHCMQGVERAGAAQNEGYAHYFAGRVMNSDVAGEACVFQYYKPVLTEDCMHSSLRTDCENELDDMGVATGNKINFPPVTLSCASPVKHRNQAENLAAEVAANPYFGTFGTEWDWMTFLRAADLEAGLGATFLLSAYAAASAEEAGGGYISFDGTAVERDGPAVASLRAHVAALLDPDDPRANDFNELGDDHGVSTNTDP